MRKPERPAIQIEDDENHFIHVTWGRTGKRAIVSIAEGPRWHNVEQCTLTRDQADELARFLLAGPDQATADADSGDAGSA